MGPLADVEPSLLFPSAAEAPARTGLVEAGVLGAWLSEVVMDGPEITRVRPRVQALYTPLGRVTYGAQLGGDAWGTRAGGMVRIALLDEPWLHVAPWLEGGVTFEPEIAPIGTAGLAVEGGWPRVRLDATGPIVHFTGDRDGLRVVSASDAGLFVEAGVTARLGADEAHHLRLGVLTIVPGVAYRYVGRHLYVGAGGYALPPFLGFAELEAGWRF